MARSFRKHEKECNAKRDAVGQPKVLEILEQMQKRISILEMKSVGLELKNAALEGQVKVLTELVTTSRSRSTAVVPERKRGPYTVRDKTIGRPTLGWGNFSQGDFLEGCRKQLEAVKDNPHWYIGNLLFDLIPLAWYRQNGEAKVITVDEHVKKDSDGRPAKVNINRRGCVRTVTLDTAIKQIFKTQWLPEFAVIKEIAGHKFNPSVSVEKMENQYNRIRTFTTYPVGTSHGDKKYNSYATRWDVVRSLILIPDLKPPKTKLQKQQEMWDQCVEESTYFWRSIEPEDLADWDDTFEGFEMWSQTMQTYMNKPNVRADKKARYIKAGGQHHTQT
jgi:hypothetical protein